MEAAASRSLLRGLKVLDLSRILAGPFATQLLGDYGADIIKIENPKMGDETRHWGPPFIENGTDKVASYFTAVNRNKRSVGIDLKAPEGRAIIQRMASQVDVLIHNFIPSTAQKLGVDYETVSKLNPKLVYAELTGYGSSGPLAESPGYDLVASAYSGLMHVTGTPTGPPVKVGVAMTDITTGLFAHGAILAALYERQQSGLGQKIEASLLESQLGALANLAANALQHDMPGKRYGSAHESIVPYQAFKTQTDYVVIAATSNLQFQSLCAALGNDELADNPKYSTNALRVENREELVATIEELLQAHPQEEWLNKFEHEHVRFAFGPINDMVQAFDSPQAVHREMAQTIDSPFGSIKVPGHAVKFSRTSASVRSGPPTLGQHTSDVLQEFGYTEDEVAKLFESKTIR